MLGRVVTQALLCMVQRDPQDPWGWGDGELGLKGEPHLSAECPPTSQAAMSP